MFYSKQIKLLQEEMKFLRTLLDSYGRETSYFPVELSEMQKQIDEFKEYFKIERVFVHKTGENKLIKKSK